MVDGRQQLNLRTSWRSTSCRRNGSRLSDEARRLKRSILYSKYLSNVELLLSQHSGDDGTRPLMASMIGNVSSSASSRHNFFWLADNDDIIMSFGCHSTRRFVSFLLDRTSSPVVGKYQFTAGEIYYAVSPTSSRRSRRSAECCCSVIAVENRLLGRRRL